MKATAKKLGEHYYATVLDEHGRLLWSCVHEHPTRKKANVCARREIRNWERIGRQQRTAPVIAFKPPAPASKDLVFRRSFVENFLQCTEYQSDSGDNSSFGETVHDGLHQYLRRCIATREQSRISDIPGIMLDVFTRHGGLHPDRYEEATDMVDEFARTRLSDYENLLWLDGEPCLEHQFRWNAGWATFTGIADRVDRMDGDNPYDPPRLIKILDYKTQWAKVQHTFQARFYAQLAFLSIPSLEGVAVEFDHLPLRNGQVFHPGQVEGVLAYFERGDLDKWFNDQITIFQRRWEGPRGHPVGGRNCQYCALRRTCGSAAMDAAEEPENREQARELVGDWIRKTEQVKALKGILGLYYKTRRPDVFDGMEVGNLAPKKPRWVATDPAGIAGHLDMMGLDGKAVLYTQVSKSLVPDHLKESLTLAGVARWELGDPEFKRRLAEGDDEGADADGR